jgi:hypothetical protein
MGKQHTDHLTNALLRTYELTTDWAATITRTEHVTFPCLDTFQTCSANFNMTSPSIRNTLSRYVTPLYGAKTQYATKDDTPPLTAKQCITIQKVTGSVLCYTRAVDPTVLCHSMILQRNKLRRLKNTGRHQAVVRLSGHSPVRHHQVSCLRHDITHPHRCLIPLSFKRTQPSRRPVFLRRQIPTTR